MFSFIDSDAACCHICKGESLLLFFRVKEVVFRCKSYGNKNLALHKQTPQNYLELKGVDTRNIELLVVRLNPNNFGCIDLRYSCFNQFTNQCDLLKTIELLVVRLNLNQELAPNMMFQKIFI